MSEPTTTTPAAEPAEPVVTAPAVPEPSEVAINDALNAATDGIEGQLVPNDGAMAGQLPEAPEESEDGEEPVDGVVAPAAAPTEEEAGEEVTPAPVVAEIAPEKDEAGVYAPTATIDPGEYTPGDYSFEVKTTDNQVHKITSLEEAETLAAAIDENPELITGSQFLQLGRKTTLMEQGLQTDKRNYDKLKEAHDAEAAVAKVREDSLNQWDAEIKYLRQKGELPAITPELDKADWLNPEIAKEPSVKATLDIFQWMQEENKNREAAGLEPIRSAIDAHNAMQLDALRNQGKEQEDKEVKTRKARGSMIGGKTSYQPAPQQEGSIVGVGGSLRDIGMDDF